MSVINRVIESALQFKLLEPPIKQQINDNIFGVFVSVERYPKLLSFPFDIHGCIGYWDKNFKPMNLESIIEKLDQVAYDATWKDERKKYFKRSIYLDILSKYKIYYMLLPLQLVDVDTGIMSNGQTFSNDNYGLIVQNGHAATYLPGVMQSTSWINFRNSLINKAQTTTTDLNISFYAYDTIIESKSIVNYLLDPIIDFINNNYGDFIPYDITGTTINRDKNQNVRNLATIYDLLRMHQYGYKFDDIVIKNMHSNLEFYSENKNDPQSNGYIALLYNIIGKNNALVSQIINELVNNVNNGTLEKDFALGNVLMVLAILAPHLQPMFDSMIEKFMEEQENGYTLDNIFRYNWHAKFINAIQPTTDLVRRYAKQLVRKLIELVKLFGPTTETNYLAVAFEALTSLYKLVTNSEQLLIEPIISHLMIELTYRRNMNGLYEFLNGTARLDITGHIIIGYLNLIDLSKSNNQSNFHKYIKYKTKYINLKSSLLHKIDK